MMFVPINKNKSNGPIVMINRAQKLTAIDTITVTFFLTSGEDTNFPSNLLANVEQNSKFHSRKFNFTLPPLPMLSGNRQ